MSELLTEESPPNLYCETADNDLQQNDAQTYSSNYEPKNKISLGTLCSSTESARMLQEIAILRRYALSKKCVYCGSPKNCPKCAYRRALKSFRQHMAQNYGNTKEVSYRNTIKEIRSKLSETILNALIKTGFIDSGEC